jgi:signal transduction histidine kinase
MPRAWVWLQLLIGWLPVWALYTTLMVTAHPGTSWADAALIGARAIAAAAVLGLGVRRLTRRVPWPDTIRPGFVALHLGTAALYSFSWLILASAVEFVLQTRVGGSWPHNLLVAFLVLGVWFYVMVAGVSYAIQATQRAARAEALAARSQLAALRAQLNPHFLFNALHTVVQLIPREPKRAAQASEQIAGLLRTTIEEDRDLVSLGEEWSFVERYLEIEHIRFGDRLVVRIEMDDAARAALLPSFALQTLVENAVRHGAAPRIESTEVAVMARLAGGQLTLWVSDTGAGASSEQLAVGGTGLQRLRERLAVLYAGRARLDLATAPAGGFTASLVVPQQPET